MGIELSIASVAQCAAAWQRDRAAIECECERAQAIGSALRRAQFRAGRWLLAALLARRYGGTGADWAIATWPAGSPRVLAPNGQPSLHVSIAHRGDVVAVAAADRAIGIDVELLRPTSSDVDERAKWVLDAEEQVTYQAIALPDRPAALLAWWVLKESWSKRDGRGLHLGEYAKVHAVRADHAANACVWTADDLIVGLCCDAFADVDPPELAATAAPPTRWRVSAVNRQC